jgi:hypothetical protein
MPDLFDKPAAPQHAGETFPTCAVCGKKACTSSQSILHPQPRTLCHPCSEAETKACERHLRLTPEAGGKP